MNTFVRPLRIAALVAVVSLLAACSGAAATDAPASPSDPLPPGSAPALGTVPPTAVPTPGRPGFGEPVGQVQCDYGGHDGSYHIHAMLRIFIGGVETDPDSDIGVDQTRCMYWVHTHDGTGGVIHVEAPESVEVTLGDFMDVWAVSYPDSAVFQAAIAQLEAGGLTVDGTVPFGTWRSVILRDEIVLAIK